MKSFVKDGQMFLFLYLEEGGKNVNGIDVVLKVFIANFSGKSKQTEKKGGAQ